MINLKNLFIFLLLLFVCLKGQTQSIIIDRLTFSKTNCNESCNVKYQICISDFHMPNSGTATITVITDLKAFQICDFADFTDKGNGEYAIDDFSVPQDGVWCREFTGTVLQDVVDLKTIITNNATGAIIHQSTYTYNAKQKPIKGKVSDLIASGDLLPLNLASAQAQQKKVCDILIVDTDYEFTVANGISSELELCPNSKIIVQKDVTLTLSKTKLFSCDEAWDKIEVEEGGKLDMFRSNVINAKTGVLADNGSEILTAQNIFEANGTGIELGNEPDNDINTLLVGNIFTGKSDLKLKTPFAQKNGMKINNVSNIVDLQSFGGWIPRYHYFGDLTNGVLVDNGGDLIVNKPIMINISSSGIHGTGGSIATAEIYGTGINGGLTTFDNVFRAIDLTDTGANIHDCSFLNNVGTGIRLSFENNQINKGSNDIINNRIEAYYAPIYIGNADNNRGTIEGNYLTKNKHKFPILSSFGHALRYDNPNPITSNGAWEIIKNPIITMVRGSSTVHLGNASFVSLRQNENIDNTGNRTNINVDGGRENNIDCSGIYQGTRGVVINASPGCRVGCNEIKATQPLSYFGACADTRTIGNTLGKGISLLYNGNAFSRVEKHTGNIFEGSAVHNGPSGVVASSRYFVDKSASSDYHPTTVSAPITNWFNDQASVATFVCTQDCAFTKANIKGDEGEDVRVKIRDNQIIFDDAFSTTMPWIAKKQLFDALRSEQAIPSEYQAFYAQNENNSIGKFAHLEKMYAELTSLSLSEQNLVDKLNIGLKNIRETLLTIKLFKEKDGKETEELDKDAWEEYKNVNNSWRNTAIILRDFWSKKQTSIESKVVELENFNEQIVTDNQAALCQKLVNRVFLQTHNTKLFSGENITTLKSVANNCPLLGGNAVYAARAMLKANDLQPDRDYDDDNLCFTATPVESKKSNINSINSVVFPNPSTTSFTFMRNESKEEATLVLVDISGRVMLNITMVEYEHSKEVNTENLPIGTYFFKVNSKTFSEVLKINIIK